MRTTIQRLAYEARSVLGLNSRPYSVEGGIAFILDSALVEPDLSELRQAILDTDKLFPWKDTNHDFRWEGTESIKYLSDGNIKVDNWTVPEKTCWFSIYPSIDRLAKGQLHAYEKYLAKIAEELAKRKLPGVATVRCLIVTRTTQEFSTQ